MHYLPRERKERSLVWILHKTDNVNNIPKRKNDDNGK